MCQSRAHNETTKCVLCLSGGPESGGNTAVVLVIRALTARSVSCRVKQILPLNTHRLTFIEICLPPTCLSSIGDGEVEIVTNA